MTVGQKQKSIHFEEINDLAEDVIISLRFDLFGYDRDGNPTDWSKVPPE